jgi:hypothetical protein
MADRATRGCSLGNTHAFAVKPIDIVYGLSQLVRRMTHAGSSRRGAQRGISLGTAGWSLS